MSLIREILVSIEEDESASGFKWVDFNLPDCSEESLMYHIGLLMEAGYVDATDASTMGRSHPIF